MKNKILNIGCGAEKYGTNFIDIYPSRPEVIRCDVNEEKFPYPDNYFDEVYSKNLLEHIQNIRLLLSEMKRVLKKGGKLYILTDNAGFLLFHIPIRRNNFLQHNSDEPRRGKNDRHYFLFTLLHLKNHLRKISGFSKIITRYEYRSPRKIIKIARPILNILNKTFLVRILNPHIIVEGYKK